MVPSSWSDLPEHLLNCIAKRLDAEINVLHFRAVCSSWRSSFPRPNYPNRPLPLKLPFPIAPSNPYWPNPPGFYALYEDTVYLLQLPDNEEVNACTSSPQQDRRRQGWLVRVREEFPGRFHVFSPILKRRVDYFPETFPRNLNVLNFRVTEVCKLHNLRFVSSSLPNDNVGIYRREFRVVLLGNSISTGRAVFAIYGRREGDLCFMRLGDEKWTVVRHDADVFYCDIAIRDDQFYAVDNVGMLCVFDSSFQKIATIPSPSVDGAERRIFNLVESFGDILLVVFRNVDSFRDLIDYDQRARGFTKHGSSHVMVQIEVYKLNEKEGNWSEVRDLGDRVLFVSNDGCWSVSAHDFAGCKGNCIYFHAFWNVQTANRDNRLRGLDYGEIGVFNLEDGTGGPLASYPGYSDMFWPPPTWLNSNTS
ncbi:hypothetical protein SLEP1_g32135 [Rubroshorea leprosula]|uniref:F-box domain-containing protein n=1 Tax=Rubroshorea leprosula TaxID=152421 RepID=A0AAV5KCG2_9ROSI|nr:hypothetical protein SLEP1_g32135 [Rubroshorea leprosula]